MTANQEFSENGWATNGLREIHQNTQSVRATAELGLINHVAGVGEVGKPGGHIMTGEYLNSLYLSEECEHWGAALTCHAGDLCHIA